MNSQALKVVLLAGLLALGVPGCERAAAPGPASLPPEARLLAGPADPASGAYRRITEHRMTAGGSTFPYRAIAGETFLTDTDGRASAAVFSFTYLRTDVASEGRPVLFVFNGGPGSASIWIHMGAIGPRRVVLDADVNPSNVPPFGLEENPFSVLDVADLVFIDPVGTGFSRPVEGVDANRFWGVDEDAAATAQFIELWLSEHGRWNSPKYVMGESYGSIRAAVLPRALMGGPVYGGVMRGITLDGIILLGTTLQGRGASGARSASGSLAAAQARSLPGLAVTSAFHGLVDTAGLSIPAFYEEVMAWSRDTYGPALQRHKDGGLDPGEQAALLAELSRLTGLTAEDIGPDLFIDERSYARLALAPQGLEIGMYDSRYTLDLTPSGGDPVADDPAMTRYVPGFVATFNQMLRDDLGVRAERPYLAIRWTDLLAAWNWSRSGVAEGQGFAVDLAWAMRRNPALRLFVASGYYDLVTTPADARFDLGEAGLDAARVRFADYESGHMLYLGGTSEAFSQDLRAFLTGAD